MSTSTETLVALYPNIADYLVAEDGSYLDMTVAYVNGQFVYTVKVLDRDAYELCSRTGPDLGLVLANIDRAAV